MRRDSPSVRITSQTECVGRDFSQKHLEAVQVTDPRPPSPRYYHGSEYSSWNAQVERQYEAALSEWKRRVQVQNDFTGANLSKSKITGEYFSKCSFKRVVATSCIFDISLTECDFSDSDVRGATFGHLLGCGFSNANLQGASFYGVLDGCDFKHANLDNANFLRCFTHRLPAASFRSTTLHNALFREFSGEGHDFSDARATGTDFYTASLDSANFARSELRHVSLSRASLIDANFRDAQLTGFVATGTNLEGADFRGARISDVTFKDCRLAGVMFAGAHFDRVTFDGCELMNTDIDLSALTGVEITSCSLTDSPSGEPAVLWTMPDGYWTWDESNQLVQSDDYPAQWWPPLLEGEVERGQKLWGVIVLITESYALVDVRWKQEMFLRTNSVPESLKSKIRGLEIVEVIVTQIDSSEGTYWVELVEGL